VSVCGSKIVGREPVPPPQGVKDQVESRVEGRAPLVRITGECRRLGGSGCCAERPRPGRRGARRRRAAAYGKEVGFVSFHLQDAGSPCATHTEIVYWSRACLSGFCLLEKSETVWLPASLATSRPSSPFQPATVRARFCKQRRRSRPAAVANGVLSESGLARSSPGRTWHFAGAGSLMCRDIQDCSGHAFCKCAGAFSSPSVGHRRWEGSFVSNHLACMLCAHSRCRSGLHERLTIQRWEGLAACRFAGSRICRLAVFPCSLFMPKLWWCGV
jgi:hypothetical protein